jgi:hypothetical protein
MCDVIVCHSTLDQKEINIKTLQYYDINKVIPHPSKIDKNVKIINIKANTFMKINLCIDENNFTFKNYKLFFTSKNNYMLDKITPKNIFSNNKKINYNHRNIYDISFFDLPEYIITKKEKSLIDQTIQQYEQLDNSYHYLNNINNNIYKTKDKINFINNLFI